MALTFRLHRLRPKSEVVMPDEVHVAEGPWLRPTHTAGLTTHPHVDLLVRLHLARPRTAADSEAGMRSR